MKEYPILAEGWLEDGAGVGKFRLPGETVKLLPEQARYLIGSGQIGDPLATEVAITGVESSAEDLRQGVLKVGYETRRKFSPPSDPPAEGA
ncbi:MAG: hypothetical protein K2X84_00665 [Beijerinckiaceae bacterium]|nr:hypothetical protein [Beijerinckiaceae bacterium]